jgi:hypothetical protein
MFFHSSGYFLSFMRMAAGSAHHQPDTTLATSPNRSAKERYEQANVSFASAWSAALPMALAVV